MKPAALKAIVISAFAVLVAGGLALGFTGLEHFRHGTTSSSSSSSTPPDAVKSMAAAPAAAVVAAASSPKPSAESSAPAFDIVRIDPDGAAVIAGRAAPGAPVELLRGNEVLGRETADQTGEFVIVPPPLPPGSYRLALRAKLPDGTEIKSKPSAAINVPARQAPSIASKTSNDKTVVASNHLTPPAQSVVAPILEPIEVGSEGRFTLRGRARPGSTLKLYLNGTAVASVTAGADQRFSVTINQGMAPGKYRAKLDEVDPASGSVIAHVEKEFEVTAPSAVAETAVQANAADQNQAPDFAKPRASILPSEHAAAPSNVVIPKIVTATVSRGDSLWRISEHSYGAGDLYRRIFQANRAKIRNPNLIYPRQIFVLPSR